MKKALKILGRVLALVLALVLLAAAALLVIPLFEKADPAAVPGSADWMAEIADDRLLSEMVIPGTHDSATQYAQLAFVTRCQSLSIFEQLEAGYRYLDIRLDDAAKGADAPRLKHGFTNCKVSALGGTLTLDKVLADCYYFLTLHPTETVIFAVKHEYGDATDAEFETLLDGYISANPTKWLLTDTVPTLGDARGKLVLLRRYTDEAGLGERAGLPFLWVNQNGHEDTNLNTVAEDEGSYTLWVQDRYEYDAADKWNAFCEGMSTARARERGDIAVHFLSTKGTSAYGHPYAFAKDLNDKLLRADLLLDGWIVVDFASPRLAERVYSVNF